MPPKDTSPANKEFQQLLHELDSESDRATAVLGCALLDDTVRSLILNAAADKKTAEKILDNSRPLGAFSVRIDLARAFGLLTADDADDMHVIRKIRNEFTHGLEVLTFDTQTINDLAGSLRCVPADAESARTARGRFIWAVTRLVFNMEAVMRKDY